MSDKRMRREEHGAKGLVEKLILVESLLKAAIIELGNVESAYQFALDERSRLISKRNELVLFNKKGEFMKQKLGSRQKKWLAELRSGKYKQSIGGLCRNGKFCCLGVIFELYKKEVGTVIDISTGDGGVIISYDGSSAVLSESMKKYIGLRHLNGAAKEFAQDSLAALNDSGAYSFKDIAKIVEEDPGLYFTEAL